jgi:N-methylhydantoinase B/oxoprolinase/acetone carboxylase alpha subunit
VGHGDRFRLELASGGGFGDPLTASRRERVQ